MENYASLLRETSSITTSPCMSNSSLIGCSIGSNIKKARGSETGEKKSSVSILGTTTESDLLSCQLQQKLEIASGHSSPAQLQAHDMDCFICHEDFGKVLHLAYQIKVARLKYDSVVGITRATDLNEAQIYDVVKSIIQYCSSKRLQQQPTVVITRGTSSQTDYLIDEAMASFTLQLQECSNISTTATTGGASSNSKQDLNITSTVSGFIESKSSGDGIAVKYSKRQTDVLTQWMIDHRDHPFPNASEIMKLCAATNLSYSQVVNWTTNVRKRNMKATVEGGKKPHHFLDFVFLAQDRERRSTIAATTGIELQSPMKNRPRQLSLQPNATISSQPHRLVAQQSPVEPPRPIDQRSTFKCEVATTADASRYNIQNCELRSSTQIATSSEETTDGHANFPDSFHVDSGAWLLDDLDLDLLAQSIEDSGIQTESSLITGSVKNLSSKLVTPVAAARSGVAHYDFWEEIVESCLPGNILDIFDANVQRSITFNEEEDDNADAVSHYGFEDPYTTQGFPSLASPTKHGRAARSERNTSPVSRLLQESIAMADDNIFFEEDFRSLWRLDDDVATPSHSNNETPTAAANARQLCIAVESDTSSDDENALEENELQFDNSFLMSADFALFEPIPEEDLFDDFH